jgi:hypothetical protein
MTPEEFRTIRITPASMTRRSRFARKREAELAEIHADGWEIVHVESERIFRRGDKVTVKRPTRIDSASPLEHASGSWWDSLDQRGKAAALVGALALLVLVLGVAEMF